MQQLFVGELKKKFFYFESANYVSVFFYLIIFLVREKLAGVVVLQTKKILKAAAMLADFEVAKL